MRMLLSAGLALAMLAAPASAQQRPTPATRTGIDSLRGDHVAIRARDYAALKRWYIDKLGFTAGEEWTDPALPGVTIGYVRKNGFAVEIIGGADPAPRGREVRGIADHLAIQGYVHLAMHVDDMARALAELRTRGVEPFVKPFDLPNIRRRLAFIRDAEGNMIELAQRLP